MAIALSPAQQAYYNSLLGKPGAGTPDELLNYVSGLNDKQARASTLTTGSTGGGINSLPDWITSNTPGAYERWLASSGLPADVLTQTTAAGPVTSSGQTYGQYAAQNAPAVPGMPSASPLGAPVAATAYPSTAPATGGTSVPDYLSGAPNYGNGFGTPAASGFSSNPYLAGTGIGNPAIQAMLDANRYQTNLGLNDAFNAITSNSIGIGGLGGSREGVAQGVAIGRALSGLNSANANLLSGLYEGQQNRDLSRYGMDWNGYNTGRGLDLQQTALGADLFMKGAQGPWGALTSAGNIFDTTAGLNTTGLNQSQQGGGLPGAVGGALGTWALGNRAGWWGNTPATSGSGGTDWGWTGMPSGTF